MHLPCFSSQIRYSWLKIIGKWCFLLLWVFHDSIQLSFAWIWTCNLMREHARKPWHCPLKIVFVLVFAALNLSTPTAANILSSLRFFHICQLFRPGVICFSHFWSPCLWIFALHTTWPRTSHQTRTSVWLLLRRRKFCCCWNRRYPKFALLWFWLFTTEYSRCRKQQLRRNLVAARLFVASWLVTYLR